MFSHTPAEYHGMYLPLVGFWRFLFAGWCVVGEVDDESVKLMSMLMMVIVLLI